jgi:hypothetical protein
VLSSAAIYLWKSFRRSRTRFRDRPETVRLHRGTGVHHHPGILFDITPERRSESSRNRVHLAPDSPKGGTRYARLCECLKDDGISISATTPQQYEAWEKIRYLREVEGALRGFDRAMTQQEVVRATRWS